MNPQDLMYTQRRFSLLHLISFVVFVAFLVYGGYVYAGKASLESRLAEADSSIADLEAEIAALEEQSFDSAAVARSIMESVEESEILWSKVISDLLEVTPLDVYYNSYSGNESALVTVNAGGDSYYSAAGLIEAVEAEKNFEDIFIPSVASSGEEEGVAFSFSFTYDDSKVAAGN